MFHPETLTLQQIRSVYDLAYSHDGLMGTDLDKEYDRVTKQTLLSFGGALTGKQLLDLGTGNGNLWQYMPDDVNGHALDISSVGIERVKKRFPQVAAIVSGAEALPYPSSVFDVVVAADTLEHTLNPAQAIHEIYRVLRPAAVLAASFPIPNSLRKWGWNQFVQQRPNLALLFRLALVMLKRTLIFGRPDFQPIDRDQTADEWAAMLSQAGFHIQQVTEWPAAPKLPIVTLIHAVRK